MLAAKVFAACYVKVHPVFLLPPEVRKPGDLVTAKTPALSCGRTRGPRSPAFGSQQHHLSRLTARPRIEVSGPLVRSYIFSRVNAAAEKTSWLFSHPHVAWTLRMAKPDDSKSQYPGLPKLEAG
jgi:hypothetical protein